MSHTCERPIAWDVLIDYWASDLPRGESDRIEEQLFSCGACTKASERIARVAHVVRNGIPPIIGEADLANLRARGVVIEENSFLPGVKKTAVFHPNVAILVHRLGGMDLRAAERIEVAVRIESTGDLIFEEFFAPFDRERGEVLIACQRHFTAYPPDVQFDVRVHAPNTEPSVSTFLVPHVFPP